MMRKLALIPLLLLLAALPMCGGSSGDDVTSPSAAGGSGRLRVSLTDKPAVAFTEVNVTIVAVRIHQSASVGEGEAGWRELPVAASIAMPINLLTLQGGVLMTLCEAQLPAGHYQQIRLVLAPNTGTEPPFNQSVVTTDSVSHALDVPSGTIKIVHGFDVKTPEVTDLTLDFDALLSVKKRGNGTYFMTPVITAK